MRKVRLRVGLVCWAPLKLYLIDLSQGLWDVKLPQPAQWWAGSLLSLTQESITFHHTAAPWSHRVGK